MGLDNEFYEVICEQLNEIDDSIGNINLLRGEINKKSTKTCPFCFGEIDLDKIENNLKELRLRRESLKIWRNTIAGCQSPKLMENYKSKWEDMIQSWEVL